MLRMLAAIASATAGAALAAGAPLVIGQTADFSGPQAAAVKETTAAARAYFDRVNKAGGVNGRPIVLESMDDGFDPKRTVENARALIAGKQVLALMLSRGTANAEALIPVTQESRIAVLAPVGGSELMHRPANHYLFNLRPPHKYEAEKAVQQLAAQGLQHIAVAYVDDAMGNDAVKGALAGLKAAGLEPVALAKIPRGEPRVEAAVEAQLAHLATGADAAASWRDHGAVVIAPMAEAARLVDLIAPEHVELAVEDPEALSRRIRHAGAIFLGRLTPEAVGDYVAGSNHVLPTSRAARFSSGLSLYDFLKRTSLVKCDEAAFAALGPATVALAEAEGLPAHARSAAIRLGQ